jgi:hypothetical protein
MVAAAREIGASGGLRVLDPCVSHKPSTMLDFRRKRGAASPYGPALERRMLLLIVGSGLVVLVMIGAGNPRNWRWLVPEPAPPPQQRVERGAPAVVAVRSVDEEAAPADAEPAADAADRPAATQPDDQKAPRLFPGVRADYLREVRDDAVFSPADANGWFHLFALLERTPNEALVQASEGPVSYFQLEQQPRAYRGRLVTVGGTVRAAKLIAAPANAFGVKEYYQLWLQPRRSSSELIALYCAELPQDFPLGEAIEAECTATGFFFKRWAYQSQGGITTAPLVIAKTLAWQPPAAAEPVAGQPVGEQLLLAVAVALVLAAVVLAFVMVRGRSARRGRRDARGHDAQSDANVGATLASLEGDSRDKPRQP